MLLASCTRSLSGRCNVKISVQRVENVAHPVRLQENDPAAFLFADGFSVLAHLAEFSAVDSDWIRATWHELFKVVSIISPRRK